MAEKKAIVLATFVQEMYIILFGIGLGNIVFLNKIDFTTPLGLGHVISAIFVISVTIRYWLDWATYIAGEVQSTSREFVIDFILLLNLLLIFAYFRDPKTEAILFISLGITDFAWVVNFISENDKILNLNKEKSRRWILEKGIAILIYSIVASIIWFTELNFIVQVVVLVFGFISVRKLSFRSVKKRRGLSFSKASISDLNDIVNIHNENARENVASNSGFLLSEANPDTIKNKLLDNKSHLYYLVKYQKKTVGFVQVHIGIPVEEESEYKKTIFYSNQTPQKISNTKNHLHILTIGVESKSKGLGVGQFLYESLFEKYSGYLFTAFVVSKPIANTASIMFHKKLKFKEVGYYQADVEFNLKNYESKFFLREP